jgi:hypothetical protein
MLTSGVNYQELLRARKEYSLLVGQITEDEADYELRMNSFNDWYLFYYYSSVYKGRTIDVYLRESKASNEIIESFSALNYSIFEYQGEGTGGRKKFVDLLHGRKIKAAAKAELPAIFEGDFFLGRTLVFDNEIYFLPGVSMLPKDVKNILLLECKRIQKLKSLRVEYGFLIRTEYFKTKWTRFDHIGAAKVFNYQYVTA